MYNLFLQKLTKYSQEKYNVFLIYEWALCQLSTFSYDNKKYNVLFCLSTRLDML